MRDEGYLTHQTALLNDPKYADMLLIAEGPPNPSTGAVERRTFYCHKVILASRSTYFDMLFGSGMREMQEREVTLTDCHPDIMEALLQFCYTGECRRPKRDMLGLLVMADRLDMPCLTAICEKAVLDNINKDTFGSYLDVASSHRLERLEAKCIDYLLANFNKADTQATLRRLSPVTLMAVLRSDNLRVPSEMHVFNSVVSWLEADSTRLEQASEVLELVRFPTMSEHELCEAAKHPVVLKDSKVKSLVVRALSCAHRQSSPSLCPVPPLFSPREEPEPWCKPRTLQGASTSFEYNGRLQYWTVPETGVYRITARGAKAADGHHRNGGCGAIMSGLFRMERGQKLRVLCGSMSTMGPHGNSGGGGGSYVVAEDEDDPLVVAGGGGGTRGNEHDFDGADASLEESGADGIGTYAEEQGVAGKPGCGGHGSPFLGLGAGGGGYRHAGEGGNASSINGVSLLTSQLASVHCRLFGGFGGGGGGCGGGGGGGYSGGGGGPGGGGGGSFVHYDALEISRNVGHEGHGNAEIAFVAADFSSLNSYIQEQATLKSTLHTPKTTPRRMPSWPQ